jgi:hypothetical protein
MSDKPQSDPTNSTPDRRRGRRSKARTSAPSSAATSRGAGSTRAWTRARSNPAPVATPRPWTERPEAGNVAPGRL